VQALQQVAADPAQVDAGTRRRALDVRLAGRLEDGELDLANGLVPRRAVAK
jgi:hypothetical protein